MFLNFKIIITYYVNFNVLALLFEINQYSLVNFTYKYNLLKVNFVVFEKYIICFFY